MSYRPFAASVLVALLSCVALAQDPTADLELVRKIGPKGGGYAAARPALDRLNQLAPSELPRVLAALDGASPLAQNWLRSVAETLGEKAKDQLPVAALETFLKDTTHDPRGRRLAYELIARVDAKAEERLIPGFLNDPSLELRRDAVSLAITSAAGLEANDKAGAIAKYRTALSAARDQDQVKTVADKLKALGESTDLVTHYGLITEWKLVAPFDNTDDKGWDFAYPPETAVDLKAEYEGKEGKIKWIDHSTKDPLALVDLTTALGKHKGAVCYAATEFISAKEQDVEFRVECVTANKLWLNGKELMANFQYHSTSGEDLDQYIARGKLKPGKNLILLKICQNEQKEMWAQRWQFQLRVCDAIGSPIFSQDRMLPKTAAK